MDSRLTFDTSEIYNSNFATLNKQPRASIARLIGLTSPDLAYCFTVLFAYFMTSESSLAPKCLILARPTIP